MGVAFGADEEYITMPYWGVYADIELMIDKKAPVMIMDIPFSLVIDTLILPYTLIVDTRMLYTEFYNWIRWRQEYHRNYSYYMNPRQIEKIPSYNSLVLAAWKAEDACKIRCSELHLKEFKRRLTQNDAGFDETVIDTLFEVGKVNYALYRLAPFYCALLECDSRYGEQFLNDRKLLKYKMMENYRKMFERNLLRPSEYPGEHAVHDAVWNLVNDREIYYVWQLKLVELLLQHGCNPNAVAIEGEASPLDLALEYLSKCRNEIPCDAEKVAEAQRLVELLKKYSEKK